MQIYLTKDIWNVLSLNTTSASMNYTNQTNIHYANFHYQLRTEF